LTPSKKTIYLQLPQLFFLLFGAAFLAFAFFAFFFAMFFSYRFERDFYFSNFCILLMGIFYKNL